MAADVHRYVDTGSVGGNGTTPALTGVNAAYATLNSWNLDNDFTDLVADQTKHFCHCRATGGLDDVVAASIASWTTDATYFITVIGDDFPADGIFDSSKYHLNVTGNGLSIQASVPYTVVKNIQITGTTNAIIGGAEGVIIDGCILDGGGCIYSLGTNVTMINCIGSYTGTYGYRSQSGALKLYNCLCWGDGAAVGYYRWTGTLDVVNCIVGNTADDFGGLQAANLVDYCCSDDGDGTNANGPLDGDWAKEFVNPGVDFTPFSVDSHILVPGLNDPASGLFSTDIIGNSYVTDNWARGPFAGLGGGGGGGVGAMMFGSDF